MSTKKSSMNLPNKIAYILLEGKTEDKFYKDIFNKYLDRIPRKYINLKGGSGVNREVAARVDYFLKTFPNNLYVYVCLDREGPSSKMPVFNGKEIKKSLKSRRVRKIEKIEAIQMIESWFFYDLSNICNYIGLPYTATLQRTYANPKQLTSKDLTDLFRKGTLKKHYKKGDHAFLSSLDIDKIISHCDELRL